MTALGFRREPRSCASPPASVSGGFRVVPGVAHRYSVMGICPEIYKVGERCRIEAFRLAGVPRLRSVPFFATGKGFEPNESSD
jgi:hypothetical protein